MNTKFTIAYDGTKFLGSQTQPNGLSVEDRLQEAFKSLNIDTKIVLSGRTDKDVHATGQVFNCILPEFWSDLKKLKRVLNRHLSSQIKIKSIQRVSKDFHSRFHAKKRVYRYLLSTKPLSPFNCNYLSYAQNIDEKKIQEIKDIFVGEHDFEYFHKTGSDKENTVRKIYDVSFYKYKDIYVFKFTANSYLRSQMRLMVGALLAVNEGRLSIEDLKLQLAKKKKVFKTPASPYGLYLSKVYYNDKQ